MLKWSVCNLLAMLNYTCTISQAEKAKKIAEGPAVLKQSESSSEPVEYESCSFQDG